MRLFGGRRWLITAPLLVVLALVLLVVTCNVAGSGVRVTISQETTRITKPLRADGYPDYIASLNERFSRGVTPENNSAVLFWKAIGPASIPREDREKYFKMLGIPPLPEKGDYFVTSDAHITAQVGRHTSNKLSAGKQTDDPLEGQLQQQYYQTLKRPWSRQEFPVWAEWLDINEKPLLLILEASKRPRRYDPLIGSPLDKDKSEVAMGMVLDGVQPSRDIARALLARSMLRMQAGKVEEAWQDLLACHRLARLVGQGPTIIEVLIAITIDHMAQCAEIQLLEPSAA
jgi:hypothetical protein